MYNLHLLEVNSSLHLRRIVLHWGVFHGTRCLPYMNTGMSSNTIIFVWDYPGLFIFYLDRMGLPWQIVLRCRIGFLKVMRYARKRWSVNRAGAGFLFF